MNKSTPVALGVLLTIVVLLMFGAFQLLFPSPDVATYGCKSEDMVEVKIVRDSYDWHQGELACVHIDNLEDGR